MIAAMLVIGFMLTAVSPVCAERLWLVIGASDSSPAGIAHKAKPLIQRIPQSLIVHTTDCGDKKPMYAWVANIADTADAARVALSRVKQTVTDAYVKTCDVKPKTLLDLRIPAIDPSIADVPDTAVNWEDDDRISLVRTLPDGRSFIVVRHYSPNPDDPLEGRSERIILSHSRGSRRILEDNCLSPGGMTLRGKTLAFQCVREQAGDHLIHTVMIFDGEGVKLGEVARCRDPKFTGDLTLTCKAESVDSTGKLTLQPRPVELSSRMN